jgi:uncharacterized protein
MTWWNDPDVAYKILTSYNRFAVVGCSNDLTRPSYRVARYLRAVGYDVIPVNPNEPSCDGQECYPSLDAVPADRGIEVVDIFRRADSAGEHVDEAIAIGAKAVWMQLGVIDEAAAERARAAGLDIVMDRCPAIDHPRMVGAER